MAITPPDPRPAYQAILRRFIPPAAVEIMADWVLRYNFDLRITEPRASKFGDYTSPSKHQRHRISINHNLNPYAFLITLVHEVAHLATFDKYAIIVHRIKPHGIEWKGEFQRLIQPFLHDGVFPPDVLHALRNYMENPAASSCTDVHLQRVLRRHNQHPSAEVHLEELPYKSLFKTNSQRLFEKGTRQRVRFLCTELSTRRQYLFHPLTEVMPVEQTLFGLEGEG